MEITRLERHERKEPEDHLRDDSRRGIGVGEDSVLHEEAFGSVTFTALVDNDTS